MEASNTFVNSSTKLTGHGSHAAMYYAVSQPASRPVDA